MSGIFFFGGMLAAVNAEALSNDAPPAASKRAAVAVLLLTLLLAPVIAWIPIKSSSPRSNAAEMETDAQDLTRLIGKAGPDSVEVQRLTQMRMDIYDERRRARDAAPYDAETWIDLGLATDLLPQQSTATPPRSAA